MSYNIKERLYGLYSEAYAIEARSQSHRIAELHEQGKGCRVYLGVTNPEKTRHVFVLYNPGSEVKTYDVKEISVVQSSVDEHLRDYSSMSDYLQRREHLARNLGQFIRAFSDKSGITYDECVREFGQVNTRFYSSSIVKEKDLSAVDYYIETAESSEVLKKELDLKRLRSLIFSGPSFDYFFLKMYKPGAQVMLNGKPEGIKQAFTTMIFNGTEVLCVFIKHLSYINNPTKVADGFWKLLNRGK